MHLVGVSGACVKWQIVRLPARVCHDICFSHQPGAGARREKRRRLVAKFWLRPGNTASVNFERFIESTPSNLGDTNVGLCCADAGFDDKGAFAMLKAKKISHNISVRITQRLQ